MGFTNERFWNANRYFVFVIRSNALWGIPRCDRWCLGSARGESGRAFPPRVSQRTLGNHGDG